MVDAIVDQLAASAPAETVAVGNHDVERLLLLPLAPGNLDVRMLQVAMLDPGTGSEATGCSTESP